MKNEKTFWLQGLLLLDATSLRFLVDVVIKENYLRTKNEPPKQKINQKPKAMLRFLKILGGTVALSPFRNCTITKAIASNPAIARSAMILPVPGQLKRAMVEKGLAGGQSHRCPSGISILPIVMRAGDIRCKA